jgi:FixJ family two-component response regulator
MGRNTPVVAIVDDEDAVRRALERLLRSAGLVPRAFASGSAFLQSLDEEWPDCVVLDLHMPHVTGFDVQDRLTRSPTRRIPIIVITGHDTAESRERVEALGAAAYLRKPVSAKLLLEAIQAALGNVGRNGN